MSAAVARRKVRGRCRLRPVEAEFDFISHFANAIGGL